MLSYFASRISTSNVEAMLSPRFSASSRSLAKATSDNAKEVRVLAMSECGNNVVTFGCQPYHKVMQFLLDPEHAKSSGIYIIRNSVNAKVYVGSAVKLMLRYSNHMWQLKKGRHHSILLQNFVNKYGVGALSFELLALCERESLLELEQSFMDAYDSGNAKKGFNVCRTAGSQLGRVVSEETRAKMREAHKAERSKEERKRMTAAMQTPEAKAKAAAKMLGKKHTPESRANMSAAQKLLRASPGHQAKMSAALKGRTFSEEAKANMSAAAKRRWDNPEEVEKARRNSTGRQHKPEALAKLSAHFKGRVISDEHRAKIKAAKQGQRPTAEVLAACKAANTGRKQSPETIAKRLASMKANKLTKEGSQA